ncbi:hypothetical protein BC832DRAFT_52946 [Gaertneriomyces semiglobifer]|nr:hypothetical protein BC832DRAFT_52946 [Gaertneriomyces semiglobifer]
MDQPNSESNLSPRLGKKPTKVSTMVKSYEQLASASPTSPKSPTAAVSLPVRQNIAEELVDLGKKLDSEVSSSSSQQGKPPSLDQSAAETPKLWYDDVLGGYTTSPKSIEPRPKAETVPPVKTDESGSPEDTVEPARPPEEAIADPIAWRGHDSDGEQLGDGKSDSVSAMPELFARQKKRTPRLPSLRFSNIPLLAKIDLNLNSANEVQISDSPASLASAGVRSLEASESINTQSPASVMPAASPAAKSPTPMQPNPPVDSPSLPEEGVAPLPINHHGDSQLAERLVKFARHAILGNQASDEFEDIAPLQKTTSVESVGEGKAFDSENKDTPARHITGLTIDAKVGSKQQECKVTTQGTALVTLDLKGKVHTKAPYFAIDMYRILAAADIGKSVSICAAIKKKRDGKLGVFEFECNDEKTARDWVRKLNEELYLGRYEDILNKKAVFFIDATDEGVISHVFDKYISPVLSAVGKPFEVQAVEPEHIGDLPLIGLTESNFAAYLGRTQDTIGVEAFLMRSAVEAAGSADLVNTLQQNTKQMHPVDFALSVIKEPTFSVGKKMTVANVKLKRPHTGLMGGLIRKGSK